MSGEGWYKNEINYTWNNNSDGNEKVMTYYAKGYFVWGEGDVNVSNISGGVSGVPSTVTISNRDITSGKGQYAYVFNTFAYVEFSFTATNSAGFSTDFSVKIRVNKNGSPF